MCLCVRAKYVRRRFSLSLSLYLNLFDRWIIIMRALTHSLARIQTHKHHILAANVWPIFGLIWRLTENNVSKQHQRLTKPCHWKKCLCECVPQLYHFTLSYNSLSLFLAHFNVWLTCKNNKKSTHLNRKRNEHTQTPTRRSTCGTSNIHWRQINLLLHEVKCAPHSHTLFAPFECECLGALCGYICLLLLLLWMIP